MAGSEQLEPLRQNLRGHARGELQAMSAALAAGRDVAPGRRLRLEGVLEAALREGLLREDEVLALCGDALPAPHGARIESGRVSLLLWQERAPVWPTTGD